jgi:hypothetical protein
VDWAVGSNHTDTRANFALPHFHVFLFWSGIATNLYLTSYVDWQPADHINGLIINNSLRGGKQRASNSTKLGSLWQELGTNLQVCSVNVRLLWACQEQALIYSIKVGQET